MKAHTHSEVESLGKLKRFSKVFSMIKTKENVFLEVGIPNVITTSRGKETSINPFHTPAVLIDEIQ
jgi:capsid portal protein